MDRNAVTVGHNNAFNVLQTANHTLGTYIIGTVHLFNIASTGVLVIAAHRLEDFTNSYIQRIKSIRVNRHFILFQVSPETVNLYNTGNAGQLAFHNPILDSAQFHRIILIPISGSHIERVLIDFAQAGRHGHQFRCTQFRGDFPGHSLYLLIDELPCL